MVCSLVFVFSARQGAKRRQGEQGQLGPRNATRESMECRLGEANYRLIHLP